MKSSLNYNMSHCDKNCSSWLFTQTPPGRMFATTFDLPLQCVISTHSHFGTHYSVLNKEKRRDWHLTKEPVGHHQRPRRGPFPARTIILSARSRRLSRANYTNKAAASISVDSDGAYRPQTHTRLAEGCLRGPAISGKWFPERAARPMKRAGASWHSLPRAFGASGHENVLGWVLELASQLNVSRLQGIKTSLLEQFAALPATFAGFTRLLRSFRHCVSFTNGSCRLNRVGS